jgi:hypothetical protein
MQQQQQQGGMKTCIPLIPAASGQQPVRRLQHHVEGTTGMAGRQSGAAGSAQMPTLLLLLQQVLTPQMQDPHP